VFQEVEIVADVLNDFASMRLVAKSLPEARAEDVLIDGRTNCYADCTA
jgi:hypothetical protein